MAAVQSVLIGGLMGYAFGNFGTGQERVNAENALLLLLGLSAIWLGCNAASKEIVGELAIYRREHDINLSTAAFIGAKYLVSGVFTVLQLAVVYALAAALAEGIPGSRLQQFLLLTIGAMAGTAMGLVISAFANTRDQATTIVPLALVPQLILAGVLVPKLPDFATAVAKVAVSGYWLTEAMKSVFIAAQGPIRVDQRAHRYTDGHDRGTGRPRRRDRRRARAGISADRLPGDAAAPWQAQSWCLSLCHQIRSEPVRSLVLRQLLD